MGEVGGVYTIVKKARNRVTSFENEKKEEKKRENGDGNVRSEDIERLVPTNKPCATVTGVHGQFKAACFSRNAILQLV